MFRNKTSEREEWKKIKGKEKLKKKRKEQEKERRATTGQKTK